MIVVDSSVWINHLNDRLSPRVALFRDILGREQILIGDLILLEVLQGVRSERDAAEIGELLEGFPLAAMLDPRLAVIAARNFRRLRALDVTIRKTVDLIIGTFCIEHGHELLHDDRDFEPMRLHLGLKTF